jgi:hypothetical protein
MPALTLVSVILLSSPCYGTGSNDSLLKKTAARPIQKEVTCEVFCRDVIGVCNPQTRISENYIFDRALYIYKVDTLPQVRFWRTVMNLHEDTALVSFAHSRNVIEKMTVKAWNLKSEEQKRQYRDSVKLANCLDSTSRMLVTTGKRFFYDFDKTSQNFQRGINAFIANGVDPWYAQAILLIESPNKLQKSNAGAYGSFQLMRDVARKYGLKVNRHLDERANFERSAYAASSLLKNICIPKAKNMLDSLKIAYNENDLWFRLLVMHVYHAGAFNVQKALFACQPCAGGMDLIFSLWKTQTARFKSASQNYSQLVLAAMLEMNERHNLLFQPKQVAIGSGEGVSAN